jgi:hypothetical protein
MFDSIVSSDVVTVRSVATAVLGAVCSMLLVICLNLIKFAGISLFSRAMHLSLVFPPPLQVPGTTDRGCLQRLVRLPLVSRQAQALSEDDRLTRRPG